MALYAQNGAAEWYGSCPLLAHMSALAWAEIRDFWLPLLRAAPHWLLSRSRWSLLPPARAVFEATGVSGSDASTVKGMGGVVGGALLQRQQTATERQQPI